MAGTTSSILGTAGLSPDQWATEVSVEAQNRSVMFNKVRRYIFQPGEVLTVPKMLKRAITAAAAQADTDLTFAALAGTAEALANKFAYSAISIQRQGLNAMNSQQLAMTLAAVQVSAADGLAAQIDADLLGLHASYTGTSVSAASGITGDLLKEAIGNLREANAPIPYFVVLHENEWEELAGIDQLDQWQIRGDQPILATNGANGDFSYRGVIISTTANVPLSTNRKGVAFSGEAFALAIREHVSIEDAFDIRDLTQKMVVISDYAYDLVQPTWACLITGKTS